MSLKPIIKWQGGKTQLLGVIEARLPKYSGTYYEPFAGGLAVLLYLQPEHAVVNDFNPELVNLYKVVQSDELYPLLKERLYKYNYDYNQLHDDEIEEYYYGIRGMDRFDAYKTTSEIEKAARFIFLNRTGFNGLHRVNKKGYNNVPWGKKLGTGSGGKKPHDIIVDEANLDAVHDYLNKHVTFRNGDYWEAIKDAKEGDFVYLDPPYFPLGNQDAKCTDYTDKGFSLSEQKLLAERVFELTERGVYVMESNSYVPKMEEFYKGLNLESVKANRAINSKGTGRGPVDEALVTNYLHDGTIIDIHSDELEEV